MKNFICVSMEYPRKTSAELVAREKKPSVGGEENKQMNNKHEKSIKKQENLDFHFSLFKSSSPRQDSRIRSPESQGKLN